MASLKISEMVSFAWSFANGKLLEIYRHYTSEVFTVVTKAGPVKGYKLPSSFDYHYINFFGIPYAKPPLGELRFKDPQPFESNGTDEVINMQFHRGGSMACQNDVVTQRQVGAENCLHLSVFTRDIKPDVLKPVMVWIHGGAFIVGSNSKDIYNPEFLLRNDVVVITINYRLGAFGFLSLNDRELKIPGNAGLKDQCMALKWVKANCADFGGDPNNITLFGESAGGASVSFHMVSEMSSGLFHKAIAMSGTAFSPWAVSPIRDWTHRLGRKLGWNGDGGEKACLAVIQNASSDSISKAQESVLTLEDRMQYVFFSFGPIVEPYESEQCFLPKDPKLMTRNAWSKNMPMIIGGCSDEGFLFHKMMMKKPSTLKKINLTNALPFQELGLNSESEKCQEYGQLMKKFYFGFSSLSANTIWTYLMLMGDKLFVHPTHRALFARVRSNSAPTYLYRFSFDSYAFSLTKKIFAGKNAEGACHADDCSYIFKNLFAHVPPRTSKEWHTIERMCECWTTFARTGNPNNEIIAPVEWKPVEINGNDEDKPTYKCCNFGNEVEFIDMPELDRMHFWDELYRKNNCKLY